MKHCVAILGVFLSLLIPRFGEPADSADPSELVRIPGETPPALSTATRLPAAPSAELPLTLTIVLNRTDQSGFDAFLSDVKDPRSPLFRGYLGQRELARRFGPSREDYDTVLDWLTRQGFTLVAGSANRLTLTVQGTREQAERAFAVRIGDYRVGDGVFYANDRDPALPARIASHVHAVIGLSDLARPVRVGSMKDIMELQEQLKKDGLEGNLAYSCWLALQLANIPEFSIPESLGGAITDAAKDELLKQLGISYSLHQVSPAVTYLRYMCAADELNLLNRLALGLPIGGAAPERSAQSTSLGAGASTLPLVTAPASVLPGAGQKVGLLEFDNFHVSDVQDFLNLIGEGSRLPQLSQVHVNGGAGSPGPDESEVLLDIDAVMSLAPGADVVVYDGPFTGRGSFQTMFNAMVNDGVTVISNSWAYCEDQTTLADVQSIDSILASAAASGITVLSGSGDRGSTCLNGSPNVVHVPASSPHITAVGATSSQRNVAGTFGQESWWDNSGFIVPGGQGGFGVSRFFARPSYQDGLTTASMRSIPDVTAPADPATGYVICQADAGGCPTNLLYGGTSVAAPIWAAIVAVLNQQENQLLGFLNPMLYPLAHTTAFHGATELGSDFAHVGLGSPNVGELHLALTGGTVGGISTDRSVAGAFPVIVPADGASQAGVVVMAVDSDGNTISGQNVQLTMNAGSHAILTTLDSTTNVSNGAALYLVTDTVPEIVTFTATIGGVVLNQHPAVRFVSPPAAAGGISAAPTTVNANGSDATTITVTLQDGQGQPSPGKVVEVLQGNGSSFISATTATTDATGSVQFTATDNRAETVVYTAVDITDGNLPIPGSATVNFVNATGFCSSFGAYGIGTAAAGYAVSTFASSFPNDCFSNIGPIGLVFDAAGNLLAGDFFNNVLYTFGPQGGTAGVGTQVGPVLSNGNNLAGLAFTKDGRLYAALQQNPGKIVELDPATAAVLRTVVTFNDATALAADPVSGDLFVSSFDGVQRISNFASGPGTLTPYYASGFTDGMVFAPDGTLYVKSGCCPSFVARVNGTNAANPGASAIIVYVDNGDGMALEPNPANPSKPFLYVNRTDGIITRVDTSALPDTPTSPCGAPCTDIYTGGTRGDFVTVGPDGCLYATQSERVIKVTKSDGTCSLTPVSPVPQIVLRPSRVSPDPSQGTTASLTATLKNVANPAGVPMNFVIAGPNARLRMVTTDAGGNAVLTYTGTLSGMDAVVAFADADGSSLHSNLAEVNWTEGTHTTFLSLNASPSGGTVKSPLLLTATLVDVSATPAAVLSGASVTFTLAGKTCTATTNAKGTASCSVTPTVAPGSYSLTASFAGTGLLLPSSVTRGVELFGKVFDAAKLWVGVENTTDHATPFDVEVRLYNSLTDPVGSFVSRGLVRCVSGLKPNSTGAKPIIVTLDGTATEPLAVRVFARVGTKSNGAACVTNHAAASGLRLYDDAIAQPSQVFNQAGPAYLSTSTLYLHSRGGTNFLDTNAPKGKTPASQDSAAVSFSQSCASDGASGLCPDGHNQWQQIGTGWSE